MLYEIIHSQSFLSFSISDLLQILLALIGFGITWRQLKRTKDAYEAAKEASLKTYNNIVERLSVESIGKIKYGLQDLFNSIRKGLYEWALLRDQALIDEIKLFVEREENLPDDTKRDIENAVTILSKLSVSISMVLIGKKGLKTEETLKELNNIIISSSSWSRRLSQARREEQWNQQN